MNKEIFRALRRGLMDRLDLARELSDQEILDEIDQLILSGTPEVCLSLKEKVELRPQAGCSSGTDRRRNGYRDHGQRTGCYLCRT